MDGRQRGLALTRSREIHGPKDPGHPTPLQPCALTGAVMALEGIRGAVALVNGPTGCKFYTAALVDAQDLRGQHLNPDRFSDLLHFGQPRVPCTMLGQEDVIYGSEAKLVAALQQLQARYPGDLVGIVNTCALSVIGEDLKGISRELVAQGGQVVLVETSGFTGGMAAGFQQVGQALVREVMQFPQEKNPQSVNLIGPMIGHYNWQNDIGELKRMLERLGMRVNAVLTAGTPLQEIIEAPQAMLNVVVYEEYGETIAQEMEECFGLPWVGTEGHAPYGLRNTTFWLRQVASALEMDIETLLEEEIEAISSRVFPYLARYLGGGTLKGLPVAVCADGSVSLALADFLAEYLGLDPVLVGLKTAGPSAERLVRKLSEEYHAEPQILWAPDLDELAENLRETGPELILGSGFEHLAAQKAGLGDLPFIRISLPIWDQLILSERPFIGTRGVLSLIEEILNALRERL